jgi:hypothetical protein
MSLPDVDLFVDYQARRVLPGIAVLHAGLLRIDSESCLRNTLCQTKTRNPPVGVFRVAQTR